MLRLFFTPLALAAASAAVMVLLLGGLGVVPLSPLALGLLAPVSDLAPHHVAAAATLAALAALRCIP